MCVFVWNLREGNTLYICMTTGNFVYLLGRGQGGGGGLCKLKANLGTLSSDACYIEYFDTFWQ